MALKDLKLNDETSGDLGGYFHVTITDLDLGTQYPLEFQYIYADKRQNDNWSAVKYFTTLGATVPNDPQLQSTDVVGGAGFVKVSWSGNDASGNPVANFDRVDVHISGTTFGDGTKPAGSFKTAGTQSFTCVAGTYIVQLKVYSLNGESSFFSAARTVTVTAVGEAIDTPVSPSSGGFSSRRILGGLEVSWNGTYGSSWSGFSAINIYAGTSSSATSGTYIKVGQMTANRVANKIVVPVDGTYVRYGEPVYIHASSVNKNDVESSIVANVTSQSSGAARATDSDINDGAVSFAKLAANTLTVDNLSAGTINSTAFIRAGTAGSARVEMSSAAISGGPAAGFYIYNSAGTAVLSAPLSGGLSINGGGTFTGALSAATGTFAGTLSAATGSFSGTITASAGSIGGVIIASDAIQNGSTSSNSTFRLDNTGKARFGTATGNAIILNPAPSSGGYYIYHSSNGGGAASGKFSVSDGGILTATGGNFSGAITNGSDYWNADSSFRFGGSTGINYSGSGNVVIGSGVEVNGNISGASGTFAGTIQSSVGYIGGWFFNSTYISNIQNDVTSYYINSSTGAMAMNNIFIRQSAGSNGIDLLNGSDLRMRGGTIYLGTGGSIEMSSASISAGLGSALNINGSTGSISMGSSGYVGVNTTSGTASDASDGVFLGPSGLILGRRSGLAIGTSSVIFAHRYSDSTNSNPSFFRAIRDQSTIGNLRYNTSTNVFETSTASDYRLKENISSRNLLDSVEIIQNIPIKRFNFKSNSTENIVTGFIAHELQEVAPFAVSGEKDGVDEEGNPEYQEVGFSSLIPDTVAALQYALNKIDELQQRLDALEA